MTPQDGAASPWFDRQAPLRFAFILALMGGCAEIKKFSVSPPLACPGDTVTVTWETNGSTTLSGTPAVAELGADKKSGTRKVTLSGPTNIRIEAHRLIFPSDASTEASVEMAPGEFEYGTGDADEGAVFACPGSNGTWSGTFTLGDSQLSSSVRIEQITNRNARPLLITRGTSTETVPPGGTTLAFQGQSPQGEWHLAVPLQEHEDCDTAANAAGGRLTLSFELSCPR